MRILMAHNFYQQPGGEDLVYATEAGLLERNGHHVVRYAVHNDRINGMGRLALAAATFWNGSIRRELAELVRAQRIDVAHFHNTFPLISPAAYSGVREAGAAVVQTLHNHRLLCPNAVMFRAGEVCEKCVGRALAWPGIAHGCYRGSRAASAMVALTAAGHRVAGTWPKQIDVYIAPSESTRQRFCAARFPGERIIVKPHVIDPDPGGGAGDGGYALFVGRLSPEKGVETLLSAWKLLRNRPELRIIGDGPLADAVRAAGGNGLRWLGRRPPEEVYEQMRHAAIVIVPSQCYETFGRAAAEALACGTPVVAAKLGSLSEIVNHGRNGRLFRAGDAEDLAKQVESFFGDPDGWPALRRQAREDYEHRYDRVSNYAQLVAIYERALAWRHGQQSSSVHHDELGRWQPA